MVPLSNGYMSYLCTTDFSRITQLVDHGQLNPKVPGSDLEPGHFFRQLKNSYDLFTKYNNC